MCLFVDIINEDEEKGQYGEFRVSDFLKNLRILLKGKSQ